MLVWGFENPDGKRGDGKKEPCHCLLLRLSSFCHGGGGASKVRRLSIQSSVQGASLTMKSQLCKGFSWTGSRVQTGKGQLFHSPLIQNSGYFENPDPRHHLWRIVRAGERCPPAEVEQCWRLPHQVPSQHEKVSRANFISASRLFQTRGWRFSVAPCRIKQNPSQQPLESSMQFSPFYTRFVVPVIAFPFIAEGFLYEVAIQPPRQDALCHNSQ